MRDRLLGPLRTLIMEPQDPYAHLGQGEIAARRKEWQEAETWCQRSLTLNDKIVDTYRLLGKALSRQGRRQEATPPMSNL